MRRAALLVPVLLLAGCGDSASNETEKYEQTWPQQYSATDCAEYLTQMTDQQRFAMAADMIASTANARNGSQGLPPDSLVDTMVGQMRTACQAADSVAMTDVAVGLFMLDSSLYTY